MSKVKVTRNKSRFRTCLRQKWIDLRQTKTKMRSAAHFTHIVHYISPVEILHFVIVCL